MSYARQFRGFTRQPENSKREHFTALALQNTTKIPREDPQETEKSAKFLKEVIGTTAGCPGCNAIGSGKRAQAHSDTCRVGNEELLKTTPEVAERLYRRSEVLNEALAKEVERNVRRSEEFGSTPGELAVPREVKETQIPPDSDPRKRRAMKASTAAAINNSSQMEGSCVVAKTSTQQNSVASGSRKDVEEEERDESRSSNA